MGKTDNFNKVKVIVLAFRVTEGWTSRHANGHTNLQIYIHTCAHVK